MTRSTTSLRSSPKQFHSNWFWWSFVVRKFRMIIIFLLLLQVAIHYGSEWNVYNISCCLFSLCFPLLCRLRLAPHHAELFASLCSFHVDETKAYTSQESNLYLCESAIRSEWAMRGALLKLSLLQLTIYIASSESSSARVIMTGTRVLHTFVIR